MKFFTSTIESRFIKSILQQNYFLYNDTVVDGEYVVKDVLYVYKNNLIKITQSGFLNSEENSANYDIIGFYDFDSYINGVTYKHVFKSSYYDEELHLFLGRYLRFIRDCKGIDLMPLYNCYNHFSFNDFYLTQDHGKIIINESKTDKYKLLSIPIVFNKTYTIAIDCPSPVLIKPVFYSDLGLVTKTIEGSTEVLYEKLSYADTIKGSLNFNKPFTYKVDLSNESLTDSDRAILMDYKKYLYLTIQLPISNTSSIVILEGDYTGNKNNIGNRITEKTVNLEYIDQFTDEQLNKTFFTYPSLLKVNDSISYPFSDRLLEYLTLNVVDKNEDIDGNIELIQTYFKEDKINGVWDNKYRIYLYNKIFNKNFTREKSDINGFLDKSLEQYVVRGV